jgi:hypothetical protein
MTKDETTGTGDYRTEEPTSYTIEIAVDSPIVRAIGGTPSVGNFVYMPALLRCNGNDIVTWECRSPFTLVFKDGTPVEEVEIVGGPQDTPTGVTYVAGPYTIDTEASGIYHYATAVFQNGRVFLDATCASLSVN